MGEVNNNQKKGGQGKEIIHACGYDSGSGPCLFTPYIFYARDHLYQTTSHGIDFA
jgi:hypothetical protein